MNFSPGMSEEIVNFAFRPEARRDFRYRIVGRDGRRRPPHLSHRTSSPVSLLDPTAPSGVVWVDTNDFVIVREELSLRPSPVPLLIKGMRPHGDRAPAGGRALGAEARADARHFTLPIPNSAARSTWRSSSTTTRSTGHADSLFARGAHAMSRRALSAVRAGAGRCRRRASSARARGAPADSAPRFLDELADSTDRYFGLTAAPARHRRPRQRAGLGLAHPGAAHGRPAASRPGAVCRSIAWTARCRAARSASARPARWHLDGAGYAVGPNEWLGGGGSAGARRSGVVATLECRSPAAGFTYPMDRDRERPAPGEDSRADHGQRPSTLPAPRRLRGTLSTRRPPGA